jgi:hypothetical protein
VKIHLFAFLYILLLSCVLGLGACNPLNSNQNQEEKKYFQLAQFVKNQSNLLEKQKPKVSKKVLLDGNTQTLFTDSIDWTKELALFTESDINSPSLVNSYDIKQENNTLIYTAKESKLKIREIQLLFGGNGAIEDVNVEQVNIVYAEDNQLYEIKRVIKMQLKDGLLSFYSIKGFQKVAFKDSLVYGIEAIVNNK